MDQVGKAISSAHSEISKLNDRLKLLSGSRLNQNNYATYATVIQYNMLKAEAKIQQSFQSIINQSHIDKVKLPTIRALSINEKNSVSFAGSSKGQDSKRSIRFRSINKKMEERRRINSTKQQISIPISNQPIKMHSFIQKHVKNNILTEQKPVSRVNHPLHCQPKATNINLMQLNEAITSKHQKIIEQIALSQLQYQNIQVQLPSLKLSIKNGFLITSNNQYHAFAHIYDTMMPHIHKLVKKLIALLSDIKVKDITLEGRSLASVAINNQSLLSLVMCIIQEQPRQILIAKIQKYQGKEGQARAATVIQALWRMSSIRREYLQFREKVVIIQRYAKKYTSKRFTKRMINEKSTQIHNNFLLAQQQFSNNYQKIISAHHFQLHVNSYAIDELKRLTTDNLAIKKNLQLTRIFRLKDPNVSIIYIISQSIPNQVISYYYRTLDLLNIDYKNRLFFLKTQMSDIFPKHFPTSKLLYYSPKCLKKIKDIIKETPCILVSGFPSSEDIRLCHQIGCFILSADPLKSKILCSKYQTRRLMASSGLPILPATTDFIGTQQMMNNLSMLIIKNPLVKQWVFKIDDQSQGRGIAWYKVSRSIKALIKEKSPEEPQDQFFSLTNNNSNGDLQHFDIQLLKNVLSSLQKSLPYKLRLAMPSLYLNYSQYIQTLTRKGGIIQAHLPAQQTKSPCVSFFINPNGRLEIISTYQKLQSEPFVTSAIRSPQEVVPFDIIEQYCRKIGDSLYLKGGLGFYSLDLLATKERNSNKYLVYAIGLDPYLNNYSCSFFYFNALMNGRFIPQQNGYFIQQKGQKQQVSILNKSALSQTSPSISNTQITQRKYIFAPYVFNSTFASTTLKGFFKNALLSNVSYDFNSRQGICVLVYDKAISGVFSLMAISESDDQLVVSMYKGAQFIVKSCEGDKKAVFGGSILASRKDKLFDTDVLNTFSRIKQRKQRGQGKNKTLRLHKLKGNLQSI